jgi:excisionase family DNA binding protein
MAKELLNVNEACRLLGGISRATFYRLLKKGEFGEPETVRIKLGGSVRFKRNILESYIDREEVAA